MYSNRECICQKYHMSCGRASWRSRLISKHPRETSKRQIICKETRSVTCGESPKVLYDFQAIYRENTISKGSNGLLI